MSDKPTIRRASNPLPAQAKRPSMKKADYTQTPSSDDLREYRFTIRLNAEEKSRLQAKAEGLGCSLSNAARILALSKNALETEENLAPKEYRRRLLLSLNSLRGSFRRIALSFAEFVNIYEKNMHAAEQDGDASSFTESTLFALTTLQQYILSLQGEVNLLLKENRAGEMDLVAPIDRVAEAAARIEKAPKKETNKIVKPIPADWDSMAGEELKFYYMQKITISGVLLSDAEKFTAEKGEELMRFLVNCESFEGGKRHNSVYLVVARPSNVAKWLVKGKQVIVIGDLSARAVLGKDGVPTLQMSITSDDIVLGK